MVQLMIFLISNFKNINDLKYIFYYFLILFKILNDFSIN